jgi:hypothetical protein
LKSVARFRQNLRATARSVFACREVSRTLFFGETPNPFNTKSERSVYSMDKVNEKTGGRKREIMLRLCVTEAERDTIYEKMRQYNTNNFGAYARKMLIDGYVINIDTADIKAVAAEMQKIGVNINQIARRVNATSRIY